MNAISSNVFVVSNCEKTLSAECSALWGLNITNTLRIVSEKTGAVTEWKYSKNKIDSEGEILYDEYIPTDKTLKAYPHLNGYKVIIFND